LTDGLVGPFGHQGRGKFQRCVKTKRHGWITLLNHWQPNKRMIRSFFFRKSTFNDPNEEGYALSSIDPTNRREWKVDRNNAADEYVQQNVYKHPNSIWSSEESSIKLCVLLRSSIRPSLCSIQAGRGIWVQSISMTMEEMSRFRPGWNVGAHRKLDLLKIPDFVSCRHWLASFIMSTLPSDPVSIPSSAPSLAQHYSVIFTAVLSKYANPLLDRWTCTR
jgi:hypothetical protein